MSSPRRFFDYEKVFAFCVIAILFYSTSASHAFAVDELCTSDVKATALGPQSTAIIEAIMSSITGTLNEAAKKLYGGIINSPLYSGALNAAILLTVVMYGAMIIFDLANLRPGEVMQRVFKIGLVLWIASPNGGWTFFSTTFAAFFYDGMLQLIGIFMEGSAGMMANAGQATAVNQLDVKQLAQPLSILGYPLTLIFSQKFGVTLIGVAFTGIYGIVMAILLLWAAVVLIFAIMHVLFVYIKCIVGLWFMFALAPIFFIFFLFQRTAQLFTGWLNMVVSFALQPILLFAFLAFFVVMVSSSLMSIFRADWCMWFEFGWTGYLPEMVAKYRVVSINGTAVDNNGNVEWGAMGALDPNMQFPIELIDVLFFWMAAHLMKQYANFVPQLASQLSQGGLTVGGTLDDLRKGAEERGWTPTQLAGKGGSAVASGVGKLFG